MQYRSSLFLPIVIIILIGFIFLAPSYGWRLRGWLNPSNAVQEDAENLAAENQALQAQIAELSVIKSQLPQMSTSTIRAMVYSRYPFNFRNELSLNVGSDQGIMSGKAVLFQGAFIGTIQSFSSDSAIVTTIFDRRFKVPVRIGNAGVEALLQGGPYPQIVSIAKNAKINAGDIVFVAGPGLPYALPIGTLADVSLASNNLFQQASLNLAYDINDIQTVVVEK